MRNLLCKKQNRDDDF